MHERFTVGHNLCQRIIWKEERANFLEELFGAVLKLILIPIDKAELPLAPDIPTHNIAIKPCGFARTSVACADIDFGLVPVNV
jgi:hypothetical protein